MIVLCNFLYHKRYSRAILSDQLAALKLKLKSLDSLLNLYLSLVSFVFYLGCSNDTNFEETCREALEKLCRAIELSLGSTGLNSLAG